MKSMLSLKMVAAEKAKMKNIITGHMTIDKSQEVRT